MAAEYSSNSFVTLWQISHQSLTRGEVGCTAVRCLPHPLPNLRQCSLYLLYVRQGAEAWDHALLALRGQYQPDSTERRPGCRRCTWCPAGASCRPTATYTWCRWSCEPLPGSPRTPRTGAWASLCTEDTTLRMAVVRAKKGADLSIISKHVIIQIK